MNYKISVALCTFNGEKYIEDQLNSILEQTRMPNEIVICDDKSTDNTINIIKSIMDGKHVEFKLYTNSEQLGVTKNFEKAIKLCTGDIIFTSDQDDVWKRDKIKIIESVFMQNPNCKLIFSDADIVDSELNSMYCSLFETLGITRKLLYRLNSGKCLEMLLKSNKITGATMAIKRELVDEVIPISSNYIHDYWIGLIAYIRGQAIGISDKLILYRQHKNNLIGASKISLLKKITCYFKNFKSVFYIRKDKFDMCKDLMEHISKNNIVISESNYNKITNCYEFWSRKLELKNESIHKGIITIIKDFFNGGYNKYYTGYRGAIRDLVCLILFR